MDDFDRVVGAFDSVDLAMIGQGIYPLKTEFGLFLPSSIRYSYLVFDWLLSQDIITRSQIGLECGCGDGRVMIAGIKSGLNIYGIEGEVSLFESARDTVGALCEEKDKSRIQCGSFLDLTTYESFDFEFRDIDFFFNYVNSFQGLARKISEEGKKDSLLILIDHTNHRTFDSLRKVATVTYGEMSNNAKRYGFDLKDDLVAKLYVGSVYLHIFQKE